VLIVGELKAVFVEVLIVHGLHLKWNAEERKGFLARKKAADLE